MNGSDLLKWIEFRPLSVEQSEAAAELARVRPLDDSWRGEWLSCVLHVMRRLDVRDASSFYDLCGVPEL